MRSDCYCVRVLEAGPPGSYAGSWAFLLTDVVEDDGGSIIGGENGQSELDQAPGLGSPVRMSEHDRVERWRDVEHSNMVSSWSNCHFTSYSDIS